MDYTMNDPAIRPLSSEELDLVRGGMSNAMPGLINSVRLAISDATPSEPQVFIVRARFGHTVPTTGV